MIGRRLFSASSRDACVPHVRAVVCVVSLVNEPLRRESTWIFTTPRGLHGHRHSETATAPSIPLTMTVTPLARGR
jgi:hypothetical protein